MTRLFCALAVVTALASASPARGALPPAYGGFLRWPAPHGLRLPHPWRPRSPFEAALARAAYGGLYEVADDGAVVPMLAEGLPEEIPGGHRIRLRGDLARQDGRALEPADVVRSLERRFADEGSDYLLAPLADEGGALAVTLAPDGTLEIRSALSAADLALRLAALPYAIVPEPTASGRSRGTGPFRIVRAGEGLELRAFRRASPAAPYVGRIVVEAPRPPERELRDLELGRLHASWVGASLYGTASRPADALPLSEVGIVLVVASPSARSSLAWLATHVDRERLRRAGITPAASLAPDLRAPALGRGAAPRSLTLDVPADDAFAHAIAREIAAQADALGVSIPIVEQPSTGARAPALRIVTIVPPLPGVAARLGAAFAAAGQLDRARSVGLDEAHARDAAPRLEAVVLGTRRDVLFHRRGLSGLRRDAYGLPVLGELHLRRRSEIHAEATRDPR